MARPLPRLIPIQSPIRTLRVERNKDTMSWMIWLSANSTFTCGTFLELYNNGDMYRVTWHPDGSESVLEIYK